MGEYPIHRGLGVYLPSLPRPEDLWVEVNQEITSFLRKDPARARKLLEAPLEALHPTDQWVRGMVLDEQQRFELAQLARNAAREGMYTSGYRSAWKSQMRFVKERLSTMPGPVVDLATGLGSLLEVVLPGTSHQFVGTDVSTRVLLRDQKVFDHLGWGDRLSFLAFDARHPPFAESSIATLVTNVGLANIEEPGDLLKELRRVLAGTFAAIMLFYPEEQSLNSEMIRRLNLGALIHREPALRMFESAGFRVQVCNSQTVEAQPTPRGEIMPEIQPDRLPVVATEVEWCTLLAR